MSLCVLSMNCHGSRSGSPKELTNINIPFTRKKIRQEVIEETQPAIILLQESDVTITKIFCGLTGNRFEVFGEKNVGLAFNTKFFKRKFPDFKFEKIFSDQSLHKYLCTKLLRSKACDFDVLAVSWHGPYNKIKRNYKEDIIRKVLTELFEFSKNNQKPFIFGGDFNFDISKINLESNFPNIMLNQYDYQKPDYRANKYDFILTNLPASTTKCCDVSRIIEQNDSEIKDDSLKKLVLDHNPLLLNVSHSSWTWYQQSSKD